MRGFALANVPSLTCCSNAVGASLQRHNWMEIACRIGRKVRYNRAVISFHRTHYYYMEEAV